MRIRISPPVLGFAVAFLAVSGFAADPPRASLTLKGHDDPVYSAIFDPQNKVIATASFDKSVRIWDANTGKELRSLAGKNGHQGQALCLAFSPDGNLLASGGGDNTVRVWEMNPAKPTPEPAPVKNFGHPNLVSAIAFDKTAALLATGCNDGFLRLWDMKTNQATKQIKAHVHQKGNETTPDPIYAVLWTPDWKQLVTASYDRTIRVWDAASGNMVREIKGAADVIVFDPKAPVEPGHRDQVFSIDLDSQGKYLASGSSDRTVKLWDFATGKLVRDFPNPAFKPSGPGQQHPSHPGFVHAVRFSPDNSRLITGGTAPGYKGYLAVWNVADGKLLYGSETAHGPIYSIDISKDGSKLLLACGQKTRGVTESDAIVVPMPK